MDTTPETNPSPKATGVASYNLVNDRLKVWFDDRLPEAEYNLFRRLGFVYWFGSKCLTRVWSPEAEDQIRSYGIEIEEDDAPDDTEARVERFSRYAARHEQEAESAERYGASDRCNTDRRRSNALNAMERGFDTAAYWNRRIEAAIRHAAFKESPGLVYRRIEGIETEIRKEERWLSEPSDKCNQSDGVYVWLKGFGRGGSWIHEDRLPGLRARAQRWIDHLNMRLTYERANLAASGSVQALLASNEIQIEVGGAVEARSFYAGGGSLPAWFYVTKVNEKSVDCWFPGSHDRHFFTFGLSEISGVMTKAQVDAQENHVPLPPADVLAKINAPRTIEKATNREGKRPEKWGAYGLTPGFSMKEEDAEWCLIIKVNAKTFDFVYESTERVSVGGKIEERKRLVKRSDPIRSARFLKSPAEVEQMPALVAMKARVVEIEARKKARKAAEKAEKEGDA